MRNVIVLAAALAFTSAGVSGPVFAQTAEAEAAPKPTDVVTLKNGDRVTGELVKMTGGKVVVKTDWAGDVTVDFEDVATIECGRSLPVEFKTGEIITGRLEKRADGTYLVSDVLPGGIRLKTEDVESIAKPEPKIWSGDFRVGLGYSSGNTDTSSASAGAEVRRVTDIDTFRIYANTNYEERDNETSAQRTWGGSDYEYNFTDRWYGKAYLILENDKFKDLTLRTTVGLSTGYKFIKEDDMLLQGDIGPAYINENYRGDTEDRDFVALAIGERFEWKISDGQMLIQTLQIFPNTEKFSDTLFTATLSYRQTLTGNLYLDIALADEYDTEPADGKERNDFRSTLGLGYSF